MKKSPLNLVPRRTACPQTIMQLWKAMVYIRQQKQISNFDRLFTYMKREHKMKQEELEKVLESGVKDGLIISKTVVGCKGSKVGVEQEGYRIPDSPPTYDGHDWYCFYCHKGGEVAKCDTCHRVFHDECIEFPTNSSNFICNICKPQEDKYKVPLSKKEINELLNHTCARLKEKTRELHRIPHPSEDHTRYDMFIYNSMDLCTMEHKVKSNEYIDLTEFYNDALQIVHNVVIYYGEITRNTALAYQMIRDCNHDLLEIQQCSYCYRMSNQRNVDSQWFCQPCNPPHELVFAKVKGYPYWPAKLLKTIKSDEGKIFHVRFFGAHHQRGIIEDENNIKPITTTLQEMKLKKTESLVRAMNELKHHQALVAKQQSGEDTSINGNSKTTDVKDDDLSPLPSKVNKRLSNTTPKSSPRKRGRPPKIKENEVKPKLKRSLSESKLKPKTTLTPSTETKSKRSELPELKPRKTLSDVKVKRTSSESKSRDPSVATSNVKRRKIKKDLFQTSEDVKHKPKLLDTKDGQAEEHNVVSSSQEITISFATVETQTEPYVFSESEIESFQKDDTKKNEKISCQCATEYSIMLQKVKEKLEIEYKQEKEKALKDLTEKLKAEMDIERQKIIQMNNEECMKYREEMIKRRKREEEEMRIAHEAELLRYKEQHLSEISSTKKKQWCFNCEKEAIYHCCWNTAYCTVECQQAHWHDGHKKTCRRPRAR